MQKPGEQANQRAFAYFLVRLGFLGCLFPGRADFVIKIAACVQMKLTGGHVMTPPARRLHSNEACMDS